MQPKFIHLHVHAMTDSGNICGAMAMMHEMPPLGIQPILGTQLLIKTPHKKELYHTEEDTGADGLSAGRTRTAGDDHGEHTQDKGQWGH